MPVAIQLLIYVEPSQTNRIFVEPLRSKPYYLLTYLLTPWSRVLLEKLTGSAANQEIPRIFGTRRFITVPTSARHLSLF